MSNDDMEKMFKFVFFSAVVVFCIVIIGFFLLLIKFILNFIPEITLLGVTMTG